MVVGIGDPDPVAHGLDPFRLVEPVRSPAAPAAADDGEWLAVLVEDLDLVVVLVGDVEPAAAVEGQVLGLVEVIIPKVLINDP